MPRNDGGQITEISYDISGGQVTNLAPHFLQPHQCVVWENFDPSRSKRFAVSRKGRSVFIPALGAPTGTRVRGFHEYIVNSSTTLYIVQEGTKVYTATVGGTYTDKTGALTLSDDETFFVQMNSKSFLVNPGTKIASYDGGAGNYAVLADSNAPTAGTVMCKWRGKIYVAVGSKLHFCKTGDGTDWTTADNAGNQEIEPNDGSDIVCLAPYSEGIIVGKKNAVFLWDGRTFQDFKWRNVWNEGALGKRSWCVWRDLPLIATPSGIWAIRHDSDARVNIANPILQEYRTSIATSSRVVMGEYDDQVWIAFDSDGSGRVDTAYVCDMIEAKWSKYVNSTNGMPFSLFYRLQNGDLLAGTDDSRVAMLKLDDTQQDEGVNMTVRAKTKAFMLRDLPLLRKVVTEIRWLVRRVTSARTASVKFILNDLTSSTPVSAASVQNAAGGDLYFIESGTLLSDDATAVATEIQSSGSDSFEIHGFTLVGDVSDGI